jgi:hypothetical protein
MNFIVHALGAYLAAGAASGRYPRPVSVGIAMLVARLGTPAIALTLAGLVYKKLNEEGAFQKLSRPQGGARRARDGASAN